VLYLGLERLALPMFPAYLEHPEHYRFEGQDLDEKILLLLRAHPITNLSWIIPAIFVFLFPFIVARLAPFMGFPFTSIPQNFLLIFLIINYLLVLIIVFEGFLGWYFNVYILTNERIVDIDFKGVLHKETAYAKLNQIQDVSPKIIGFFGTFFHFGNIYIQTAAERAEFEFNQVARPDTVAQEILEQVRKEEAEAPGEIA